MNYEFSNLKFDLTASVVVFLVAIPLCLGIALASGAPLLSGLVSGIIGGIIVGLISESPVSVSGPAAGMAAVVLTAITQLGSFNYFLLALIFAGLLQILIGFLRAGFIADYIPSNVIQGLLCAIGILIIVKQLPFIITYTSDNYLLMDLLKDISGNLDVPSLAHVVDHINLGAITIGLFSLGVLIYFDKTKNSVMKQIPGPVVVVLIGSILNELFAIIAPTLTQSNYELVNLPVSHSLSDFFGNLQTPDWSAWKNPDIYIYGFILAAVASLEALLNLEGIQRLDKVRRYTSRNRELVAQGIGNTFAGFFGGLPITSVIVRSSVNIDAGSRSKLSTILHGVWILLIALLLPHWINAIPLATLAAILIHVGYKLTKPQIFKKMYLQGASRFIPFVITILAIILTNLLTGVIVGLLIGFFFILRDNAKIQLDIVNEKYPSGEIKRLILPQHMSFLRKASLVEELASFAQHSRLIIDARYTKYIDKDILEVLSTFQNTQAPAKNIAVNMLGFKDSYEIHNHIEFVNVTNYTTQSSLTPEQVMTILMEGNTRFTQDKPIHRELSRDVKASAYTQHPIAIILGCIDSRVPVESIFDMGFGDVFVSRVAGNVMNDDIIASVEFACMIAGAKLILVLGHTYCGAVKAACDNKEDGGHLSHLLDKIKPAIAAETTTTENRTSDNIEFLTNVTRLNVENTLKHIYGKSAVINRLINQGAVGLKGATYDIKTGVVHIHETTLH
jgi:carbonic anhydrase